MSTGPSASCGLGLAATLASTPSMSNPLVLYSPFQFDATPGAGGTGRPREAGSKGADASETLLLKEERAGAGRGFDEGV